MTERRKTRRASCRRCGRVGRGGIRAPICRRCRRRRALSRAGAALAGAAAGVLWSVAASMMEAMEGGDTVALVLAAFLIAAGLAVMAVGFIR